MQSHPAYTAAAAPHSYVAAAPPQPGVKAEPIDTRYMLHNAPQMAYALPHLPGPAINGARQPAVPQYGSQTSILSFPPGPPPVQSIPTNGAGVPLGRAYVPPTNGTPIATMSAPPPPSNSGGGGSSGRIPQLDGPSEDESDEDSQTPPPYAPRSTHPSLPQPQASTSASADSEAINSDLDDSDTGDEEEADDGAVGETDIVFCTYDKVSHNLCPLLPDLHFVLGRTSQEQVEMHPEGWNDSCKWKRLSLLQMYWVRCLPNYAESLLRSLLSPVREFEW